MEILKRHHNSTASARLLAQAYKAKGDVDEEISGWKEILEQDPESCVAADCLTKACE